MEGKFKVERVALRFMAEDKTHELRLTFFNISYPEYITMIGKVTDFFKKAEIENFEIYYTIWDRDECCIDFTFDTSIDAYEAYEALKEKVYFEEETDGNENGAQTQESCELSQ